MLPDGALVNDPTDEWYVPITPVHAKPELVVDAYVSASRWEPPTWSWSAGEIEARVVFEEDGKRAYEAVGVRVTPNEPPTLFRYVFDMQRAESGYEGDARTSRPADSRAVENFIEVVRSVITPFSA